MLPRAGLQRRKLARGGFAVGSGANSLPASLTVSADDVLAAKRYWSGLSVESRFRLFFFTERSIVEQAFCIQKVLYQNEVRCYQNGIHFLNKAGKAVISMGLQMFRFRWPGGAEDGPGLPEALAATREFAESDIFAYLERQLGGLFRGGRPPSGGTVSWGKVFEPVPNSWDEYERRVLRIVEWAVLSAADLQKQQVAAAATTAPVGVLAPQATNMSFDEEVLAALTGETRSSKRKARKKAALKRGKEGGENEMLSVEISETKAEKECVDTSEKERASGRTADGAELTLGAACVDSAQANPPQHDGEVPLAPVVHTTKSLSFALEPKSSSKRFGVRARSDSPVCLYYGGVSGLSEERAVSSSLSAIATTRSPSEPPVRARNLSPPRCRRLPAPGQAVPMGSPCLVGERHAPACSAWVPNGLTGDAAQWQLVHFDHVEPHHRPHVPQEPVMPEYTVNVKHTFLNVEPCVPSPDAARRRSQSCSPVLNPPAKAVFPHTMPTAGSSCVASAVGGATGVGNVTAKSPCWRQDEVGFAHTVPAGGSLCVAPASANTTSIASSAALTQCWRHDEAPPSQQVCGTRSLGVVGGAATAATATLTVATSGQFPSVYAAASAAGPQLVIHRRSVANGRPRLASPRRVRESPSAAVAHVPATSRTCPPPVTAGGQLHAPSILASGAVTGGGSGGGGGTIGSPATAAAGVVTVAAQLAGGVYQTASGALPSNSGVAPQAQRRSVDAAAGAVQRRWRLLLAQRAAAQGRQRTGAVARAQAMVGHTTNSQLSSRTATAFGSSAQQHSLGVPPPSAGPSSGVTALLQATCAQTGPSAFQASSEPITQAARAVQRRWRLMLAQRAASSRGGASGHNPAGVSPQHALGRLTANAASAGTVAARRPMQPPPGIFHTGPQRKAQGVQTLWPPQANVTPQAGATSWQAPINVPSVCRQAATGLQHSPTVGQTTQQTIPRRPAQQQHGPLGRLPPQAPITYRTSTQPSPSCIGTMPSVGPQQAVVPMSPGQQQQQQLGARPVAGSQQPQISFPIRR